MSNAKTKKEKEGSILQRSPINYFSDLFVVTMVIGWIAVLIIMVAFAIFSTIRNADTSMWSEVGSLVAIPLSCGGGIWMVKNSVQHAIAYSRGERAHMDFPAVNADGEGDGVEELLGGAEKEGTIPQ